MQFGPVFLYAAWAQFRTLKYAHLVGLRVGSEAVGGGGGPRLSKSSR